MCFWILYQDSPSCSSVCAYDFRWNLNVTLLNLFFPPDISGRSTTVRPLNCRCCSRSATRLSAATRGASEEATSNASATNVNSTTIASRDQRRTSATSSNQARHGRHHRRRNRWCCDKHFLPVMPKSFNIFLLSAMERGIRFVCFRFLRF